MKHLILLALLSLFAVAHAQNNWAAAACCAYGPKCWWKLAATSGPCKPNLWMTQQSPACRQQACAYCRVGNRRKSVWVCRQYPIEKNCYGRRKPKPQKPKPQQQQAKPPGQCIYRSQWNRLVIPATKLPIYGAWSRVGDAIVWKKWGGHQIDPAGSGSVCARVQFDQDGVWYLTAVSSAPHPTEYNDVWISFDGGLDLFRPEGGSFKPGGKGWYKGYQNAGGNRIANYLLTIDFNGHQFLTKPVRKGWVYKVCLSGRSAKHAIYKLVFVKCGGGWACSRYNGHVKKVMSWLPAAKCY